MPKRTKDERRNPQATKTHCAKGHEYTPENTWTDGKVGTAGPAGVSALRWAVSRA